MIAYKRLKFLVLVTLGKSIVKMKYNFAAVITFGASKNLSPFMIGFKGQNNNSQFLENYSL